MRRWGIVFAFAVVGCNQKNPYEAPPAKPAQNPAVKLVGIDPAKFDCAVFLPTTDVQSVVGNPVVLEDLNQPVQEGTPKACSYVFHYQMTDEERAEEEKKLEKLRAKQERAQKTTMEDAIAEWGTSKDRAWGVALDCRDSAHQRTIDWMASLAQNGTVIKDVTVGKKAIDHSNAQLVFLDDKTPCAVTITGGDEPVRMALAQLVYGKLKPENAPMRPRAAPR